MCAVISRPLLVLGSLPCTTELAFRDGPCTTAGPIGSRSLPATMSRAVLLAGLIYDPHGSHEPAETKKGVLLYSGTAAGFEVWAYRINVKLGAMN